MFGINLLFDRLTHQYFLKLFLILPVMVSVLSGCEARLNLDGVENTLKQPIRRTDQLMSIQQLPSGVELIFGDNGLVLNRAAGVKDWRRAQLGSDGSNPNFIDSSVCPDGMVVALSYQGQVWSSTDQGEVWKSSDLSTTEEVQAIDCTPAGDIWVVGSYSTLLVSKDRGNSWHVTTMDEDAMLTGVSFISNNIGFVVGEFGMLLVTQNSGESWEILDPIRDDFYPLGVYFENANRGWVSGLGGVIMHTLDGGISWERQKVATDVPIYNFISNGSLYATGGRGTVLKLEGDSWVKVLTPDIPTYYRSGIVTGENSLLIVGGWGVLLPLDLAVKK